jgi:RNA polymerase sigma-70 factor (ECF subfamily)
MNATARARVESLFREHAAAVRAYARRRIDPTAAEDVVSEVFVVAFRRADEVPVDALPWLLACARRLVANHRRASARRAALLDRVRTLRPSVEAEPLQSTGRVTSGLAQLSESDREVLMLIAWEGLDPDRAARVLGCSRSAFAMRLHRARKRLAAALEQSSPAATPDHLPARVDSEEVC